MRVAQEEIFGPVVSVITYEDEDEAIAIANDSIYGLSGAVYTADLEHGFEVAQRIRTGTVSVNATIIDFTVPSAATSSPASDVKAASRVSRSSSRPRRCICPPSGSGSPAPR